MQETKEMQVLLILGSGTSPGAGNSNPLQYSRLENSMDRETRQAPPHGAPKESDMTERASATKSTFKRIKRPVTD